VESKDRPHILDWSPRQADPSLTSKLRAAVRCLLVDGEQRILKIKEGGTRSRLIGIRVKSELVIHKIRRRVWSTDDVTFLQSSNELLVVSTLRSCFSGRAPRTSACIHGFQLPSML